jgi:membrane-bound ClpP family serine protease
MTSALTWAIILLVVGLIILVIEVFVPSGGLLGLLSGASLLTSVGLAFYQGLGTGLVFLFLVFITAPTVIGVGMQYWPDTRMGRKFVLVPPKPEEVDPARDRDVRSLVGQVGKTLTPHLPSGISELGGRRVDTIAEGMGLEAGTLVRVVAVQGNRVLVRKVELVEPKA